ncbi:MAG: diacylglycerol kinase family protein [Flavobacteriales bacterium]
MTVSNTGQWGNNFKIAPQALVDDGKLNLCLLQKMPVQNIPVVFNQLINGKIRSSKYYTHNTCEHLKITNSSNESIVYHIDGEPREAVSELEIEVRKSSLKVLIPGY